MDRPADRQTRHLARRRDQLGADERRALGRAVSCVEHYKARDHVIVEGDQLSEIRLLLEGVSCRQKAGIGGRRQITTLHMAGDFVDLHSFRLKRLDHDVAVMTACRFAVVPHEAPARDHRNPAAPHAPAVAQHDDGRSDPRERLVSAGRLLRS